MGGWINDGQMNTSWVRVPLYVSEEMKILLAILFNCCHLVDKIEMNPIDPIYSYQPHFPLYYPIEKGSLGQTYHDFIGPALWVSFCGTHLSSHDAHIAYTHMHTCSLNHIHLLSLGPWSLKACVAIVKQRFSTTSYCPLSVISHLIYPPATRSASHDQQAHIQPATTVPGLGKTLMGSDTQRPVVIFWDRDRPQWS